jgi:tRNA pseudouridine55 synthase
MTNDGIINIYKEKGYTSHDVVAIIKRTLKIKAGHTGTLDPEAEGVLPVCLGKATKLADYIQGGTKGYRALLRLGIETDTQDMTGNIICQKDEITHRDEILKAILSFAGEQEQIPPMYSAIKVSGQKLYELARKGVEIERKPRAIHIYAIENIEFINDYTISMDVLCSKGTYIRTLCHDIGKLLGCGGCMEALTRIQCGKFFIKDSIKLEVIKELAEKGDIESIIIPPDEALYNMKSIFVREEANKYLYNGNKISTGYLFDKTGLASEERYKLYNYEKKFIGIYKLEGEFVKPVTILTDLSNI